MKTLVLLAFLLGLSTPFALGQSRESFVGTQRDSGQGEETTYRLRPVDTVNIRIYREPEMSGEQRVDSEGRVTLPLIGSIVVQGMTVREAQKTIRDAFIEQQYLRDPSVQVAVVEHGPRTLTVRGEVEEPGEIELPAGRPYVTISQAIALAGDFSGTADEDDVVIRRSGGRSMKVDVSEQSSRNAVKVYPGDTIIVPRSVF
ncbi:MAG: polysaccharide biosynthesis/export family protein [Opitutales bacterium]